MLTKDVILNLLETNDRAIARALVVLTERQTSDEKSSETTRHLNNRGFRPCHARMGTSMAKFFTRYNKLSEKQINYWRKRDKQGNMRIGIYWKQLIEASEQKMKMNSAVENVEREMQRMEAKADQAQTIREETNKRLVRAAMER